MIRSPQARRFYPGDLPTQVAGFLEGWEIPAETPPTLVGGVVPHAGWDYSGRTAARTFHTLVVRCCPRTIVLLGSVHVPEVVTPSVDPAGAWETPVGDVVIDEQLVERLGKRLGHRLESAAWAHTGDHALEVQMPFLRLLAPGCRVVPIAFPPCSDAVAIGEALGEELRDDPEVIVVASSDLTHYGDSFGFTPAGEGKAAQRWMLQNDARMIRTIKELEAEAVFAEVEHHQNACGPGAVAAALAAARVRGSTGGHLIEYTNSFLVSREEHFKTAVGYVGAVF